MKKNIEGARVRENALEELGNIYLTKIYIRIKVYIQTTENIQTELISSDSFYLLFFSREVTGIKRIISIQFESNSYQSSDAIVRICKGKEYSISMGNCIGKSYKEVKTDSQSRTHPPDIPNYYPTSNSHKNPSQTTLGKYCNCLH